MLQNENTTLILQFLFIANMLGYFITFITPKIVFFMLLMITGSKLPYSFNPRFLVT